MNRSPEPDPRFGDPELDALLGAYALHAVEDDERDAVDSYLARSPRARAEVNELQAAAAWLGNSTGDLPRELWSQIATRLDIPSHGTEQQTQVGVRKIGLTDHASDAVAEPIRSAPHPTDPVPTARAFPARRLAQNASQRASQNRSIAVAAGERPRSARRTLPILAAAATIAVAVQGTQLVRQRTRLSDARAQVAAAQQRTDSAETRLARQDADFRAELAKALQRAETYEPRLAKLISSPTTRTAELVADGHTVARVILGEGGDGFVLGVNLAPAPPGHTYQLWGVKGNTVLSLGVLGPEPVTVPIAASGSWAKVVLTSELDPGVGTSTQPPIAVGEFT